MVRLIGNGKLSDNLLQCVYALVCVCVCVCVYDRLKLSEVGQDLFLS